MSKVAFVFFGQVKNFDEKQHFSFEQNIGKQIEGNDVDYFLVTSKSSFYFNSRQADAELEPKAINYKSIQKYFEFKEIFYDQDLRNKEENICDLAERVIKFGKAWKDGDCLDSAKKSLKQIYSLEYFINLFSDRINDYDYFILSRSDLFFTHPLSLECLQHDEDLFAPYYNNCPQVDYGWFGGINDRFAVIKNKKALISYCTRYSAIKSKPEYYHAEKYLLSKLKKDNVSYGKINNFMFLMQRADGSLSDLVGSKKENSMNCKLEGISKSYFINLDERLDRLFHIYKNTDFSTQRVSAISAKKVKLNDEVKKLFPKTWKSRTKAEICCALSHYGLWKKLVQDKNSEGYLILEDDAVFKDGFVNFWNQEFSKQMPSEYSIIYLGGCQPWNKPHYPKVLERYNDYFCRIKKNDFFTKNDHFWHMNASSYILSKNAASLLCQWVDQNGMDNAVDNFMQNFFNKNKSFEDSKSIYHLNPLMSYQLHEENDNTELDKKSDLRFAEEKFDSDERISVIIPTIWAANDYMMKSLLLLDKVECVEEVIVIDNNKTKTPYWVKAFQKVKLVDSGKRMYFNESVNFGIGLCKNDICCIYNDDIISDTRVFNYVKNNLKREYGCIFISPNYINKNNQSSGSLKKVNNILKDGLHHGSGMMMFLRKQNFIKIPRELVHHFGDTFIFAINKIQDRQNYVVEGFPIKTPGSASEDDDVRQQILEDWKIHKHIFDNLIKFIPKKEITFPLLRQISDKQIPRKIHLSWKNKNVLNSHYELIRKGAKNLEVLNPDWDVQVYDDEDVNRLLRDSIGRDNWNLIKDKKITEKTDLWRLLKTYKEGGLYIDIDRYIDTPLSEIIDHETSCVLPTFQDVDFSQDFILTCAKNPIIGRAIANNLNYRKQGKPLFFLAVYSYMQSVCEVLGEKVVDRGNNPEYFNNIRNKINQCEYLETYREIGPEHHTLFRNTDKQFDPQTFEKDKADFYNGEDVIHWNAQTQAFHNSQKTKKQKLIFTQNNLFEQDFICEMFDGFDVVINEDMNIVEQDSVIVYSDMYAKNINAYPEKFRENLNQLRAKQKEYFEKLKNKNCILVHLSDEHCHAEIDHYKNFKHVFRQYYRKDAVSDNVTFIPLGCKKEFKT